MQPYGQVAPCCDANYHALYLQSLLFQLLHFSARSWVFVDLNDPDVIGVYRGLGFCGKVKFHVTHPQVPHRTPDVVDQTSFVI
jgi:hypothetical protein